MPDQSSPWTTPPPDIHHPRLVLVTGGAGFIGSNLIRYLLRTHNDLRIINLDALTYAGNRQNLMDVEQSCSDRYEFLHGDITDAALTRSVFARCKIDTVVHLAAESHVDRSIESPGAFIQTNVVGTANLLIAARAAWKDRTDVRFHHVSTDEVFGSLGPTGMFSESSPYDPSSPYSATKAAADHLVRAWHRTYGMPVTLSNCSNNYGPFHFPEKLIPLVICRAIDFQPLPVYGDGGNIRDWLYVEDHCKGLDLLIRHARPGSTYALGGRSERTNLDIVGSICDILDTILPPGARPPRRSLITFVKDRPGHDRRYAIDSGRVERELGWKPLETFESGLMKTVQWYLDHPAWIKDIQDRTHRDAGLT